MCVNFFFCYSLTGTGSLSLYVVDIFLKNGSTATSIVQTLRWERSLRKKIKERRIKVFWLSQSREFDSILFEVSASDLSEQKSLVSPLKSKGKDETASIYRWQSRLDWICIATSYDADDDDADRKQTFSTPAPGVFFFYFLVKYSVNSLH